MSKFPDRLYNQCPRCLGSALNYTARPLPYDGKTWKHSDPLPRYIEDVVCRHCAYEWAQIRKGAYAEILATDTK